GGVLLRFACGDGTTFMTSSATVIESAQAHDGGVRGMEMAKVPRGLLNLRVFVDAGVVQLAPFHTAPSIARPPEDKKQYPDYLWSTSVLESETACFGLLTGLSDLDESTMMSYATEALHLPAILKAGVWPRKQSLSQEADAV
ncbi:hypothetical protein SELMODRAFT_432617, partial [Selaginella moellendorffii]